MMQERSIDLAVPLDEALLRLEETADAWGGAFERDSVSERAAEGKLVLPAVAGLRRGWVGGELSAVSTASGSRLTFRPEEESWRVDPRSVVFLVLAALGGLVTMVAPFFPVLWPLLPIGLVMGIAAWFFIVARLVTSGPEEFFEDLADGAESDSA